MISDYFVAYSIYQENREKQLDFVATWIPGKPRKCPGDETIHSYIHYIKCTRTSQLHNFIEERGWFAAEALIKGMIQRMEGLEMLLEPG